MESKLSKYSSDIEIDNYILNHTNIELMKIFTKSELSDIYTARFKCKPRSKMSKLDITEDLRLCIKYIIRNRALIKMSNKQ